MIKHVHLVVLAALAAFAFSAAPAVQAAGGGGGVPSPFVQASNHKVELADGELYTLEGMITDDSSGNLYFYVNLKKHPWLANKLRERYPYYRIDGDVSQWQQYEGKKVLLVATAHVVVSGGAYEIVLEPVNSNPARSIVKFR